MPTVRSLHRVPRGEIGYMAFGMFIEDNSTFALVLMIPPWERELRSLRFEQAYMAAALSMPSLVPWVHPDQSEAISPVLPMGSLQNVHRSLLVDGEPVAAGIQPIGDALCHTNPTFAYGASLSVQHAFTLARVVSDCDDPFGIAGEFDAAAQMGEQCGPVGPGLSAPFRRTHAAEDHIHQHAGAACRIVQGQPAFRPAFAQPVGKVLTAGKHAFALENIDELGKLRGFAEDELQEAGAIRIHRLVHVDHEDPLEAFGDRKIFGRPRQ